MMDEAVFAPAVYSFLHYLYRYQPAGEGLQGKRILDCGAGGPRPPIALFAKYGLETSGIDISEERLQMAQSFFREHGLEVDLRVGDVREIEFGDSTFDYVFEFYTICHLSHDDTAKAINEMRRILKPGGVCYLGFMSPETWPLPGHWVSEGEVVMLEGGEDTLHSVFTPTQAETLLGQFEILRREINMQNSMSSHASTTLEEWEEDYERFNQIYSLEEWMAFYPERVEKSKYVHLFYVLRKPAV
jgi:SAM-dependent methyltransferase